MNNKHPELACRVCDYIPDDDDIHFTHYHLSKCETCGRCACDLCLSYNPNSPKLLNCCFCLGMQPIGNKRKYWLAEEYGEQ